METKDPSGPGRLEAVYVAEMRDGQLVSAGPVKFGLGRARRWQALDRLRDGLPTRRRFTEVQPEVVAQVNFFGGYRAGWIRDGVVTTR